MLPRLGSIIILCALISSPTLPRALAAPSYMTSMELSHDNGYISSAYGYQSSGSGAYIGVQYFSPSGNPWYLSGIKYYVWQGWPDSIFQGFGVACWKFENGAPGAIVWPSSGDPIYNPNTGGNWIIQDVNPNLNLLINCPEGFLVGIEQIYDYPAFDAFGIDNTGAIPYDWAHPSGGVWDEAPYGKGSARAFVNDIGNPGVETTTIGQVKALYR
jgi:hypothetical protein